MRGGLWSSSSVPGAGIWTSFEEYCEAGQEVKSRGGSGGDAVAGDAGFEFLVGRQAAQVDARDGRRAR